MSEVGVFDAKNRLSALLDEVEQGHEVIITRRGKPVAKLVGVREGDRVARLVREARQLRDDIAKYAGVFTDDEIRAMRDEGRR